MKYTFLECVGFYEAMDDAITNIHLKHNHLPFLKHFEKEGQEFDEDGWCKCQECQECKSIEGRYN
jgi:hypothetical protein